VSRQREPLWLARVIVDAVHTDQIREHGGMPGIKDENALESALAGPRRLGHYGTKVDLAALAAAYAFGLVRNHPYRDGNKRIGFIALITFLELNGQEFVATDADVVAEIVELAARNVTEAELADWIRSRIR
jgi:death-on-curing protein